MSSRLLVLVLAQLVAACGGPSNGSVPAVPRPTQSEPKPPPSAEHRIAGTRVHVTLPPGFQRVPHLGLFRNEATGTVVLIAEVDSADPTFIGVLTKGALQGHSGAEPARTKTTRNGKPALLFESDGLLGVAVSEAHSQWIVFVFFPEPRERTVARAVVSSARFDAAAEYDPMQAMGIRLVVDSGLRLSGSMGALLFLEPSAAPPREASLLVSRIPKPMDFETSMTWVLQSTPELHVDRKSAKVSEVVIDGMRGGELVADGAFVRPEGKDVGVPTDSLITFYFVSLPDDSGVFLFQGKVDTARKGVWLPRLQRMVRSLERVR